ncbi:hypothetical protein [Caulobacter sp. DWR3-1-2]|uniref:hypothetical protein n=1 Tax=Caulobacter sp. DWR3-1-2 TaxID=2804647 RepID=UPI003CF8CE52
MTLSSAFTADLQRSSVVMFCAIQIDLPSGPVRNLDGAGFVSFTVDGATATFTGRDAVFGVMGGITEITDGIATEAPAASLNLLPKTNAAMAALAAPAAQRSRIRIWVGSVDRATGAVIDVDLWYDGDTSVPTQGVGKNSRVLSMTTNSALMKFLEPDEGARLNDGWLQSAFPGKRGLQFITSVEQTDAWGSDAPRSPIVYVPTISTRLPVNLR